MPTISVPGQGDVEFPDSMSDADITAALKKIAPPPAAQEPSIADRLKYAAHKTAGFLPSAGAIAGGAMGGAAGAPLGPLGVVGGAGVGAGLLSAGGKALQHTIDTSLGYEGNPGISEVTADAARTGAKDAVLTAATGAAVSSATGLPAAIRAARGLPEAPPPAPEVVPPKNALRRLAERSITPTPDAEFLQSKGVPLTAGQLNPRSAVGQVEEASTSIRGVGPAIENQRNAAKSAWRTLVMREAAPPGMDPSEVSGAAPENLASLYERFKPAYAAVKGEQVYPAIHSADSVVPLQGNAAHPGAMDTAAMDPSVLADDATRGMVQRFLSNQVSALPARSGGAALGDFGPVDAGDLIGIRSNIRDAIRSAAKQQNYAAADLLRNGEQRITDALESQLSQKAAEALKAVDAKYRTYKILEDAMSRAGDSPSGFSPSQLSAAIKAGTTKGDFARGGGGDLREWSRAGKSVFESVTPPTGARLLTVGPLAPVTGPATFLMNRPGVAAGASTLTDAQRRSLSTVLAEIVRQKTEGQ